MTLATPLQQGDNKMGTTQPKNWKEFITPFLVSGGIVGGIPYAATIRETQVKQEVQIQTLTEEVRRLRDAFEDIRKRLEERKIVNIVEASPAVAGEKSIVKK